MRSFNLEILGQTSSKQTFINTFTNTWLAFGLPKEMKINILSYVKDQTMESSAIEEHGSHSCNSSS